jgi:hypothetical protein
MRWNPGEVVAWRQNWRGHAYLAVPGEEVLAEWPFATGWEKWEPDPTWTVPEHPDA